MEKIIIFLIILLVGCAANSPISSDQATFESLKLEPFDKNERYDISELIAYIKYHNSLNSDIRFLQDFGGYKTIEKEFPELLPYFEYYKEVVKQIVAGGGSSGMFTKQDYMIASYIAMIDSGSAHIPVDICQLSSSQNVKLSTQPFRIVTNAFISCYGAINDGKIEYGNYLALQSIKGFLGKKGSIGGAKYILMRTTEQGANINNDALAGKLFYKRSNSELERILGYCLLNRAAKSGDYASIVIMKEEPELLRHCSA